MTRLDTERTSNRELRQDAQSVVTDALAKLLADTAMLALKTQNYHWNGVGPQFYGFHKMTEQQYEELNAAMDLLAERLRALGRSAPGTYMAYSRMTSIAEDETLPPIDEMARQLIQDHDAVIRTAHQAATSAEHANDQGTLDLLGERTSSHEKMQWMLRSTLEQQP